MHGASDGAGGIGEDDFEIAEGGLEGVDDDDGEAVDALAAPTAVQDPGDVRAEKRRRGVEGLEVERIDAHNDTHVSVIYGGFAPKCRTGAFYGDRCAWNREHLWPQSYGVGESSGLPASAVPRADMHALVPSVAALNSARSNRAFVDVLDRDGATCASDFAGCETPACTSTACGVRGTARYGDDTWTPPVEKRGFIARAMLYMDVRYDGDEPDTFDLRLGELDEMRRDDATGTFVFAALSDILRWHETHPVERWERERNDAVCGKQGNRNPFVDKPELVEAVFGVAAAAAATAHAHDDERIPERETFDTQRRPSHQTYHRNMPKT